MFGLGGMEVLVILLVGVVVLGPERLPKVMRSVTKVMSEFRRISTDLQRTINSELSLEEYNRQQQLGVAKPVKKKKKKKPAPEAAPDSPTLADEEAASATPTLEADDAQPAAAPETEPALTEAPASDAESAEKSEPENGPKSEPESGNVKI